MNIPNHMKGLLLASMGVVIISPDSLLIRYVDIDLWTLMFLRGLFIALSLMVINLLMRSSRSINTQIRELDVYAWIIVILMAICSFTFVAAIQSTSVAHALIIVGAAPIFSAALGFIVLKERVSWNTLLTICIVFGGLIFVVNDQQESHFLGDVYAFITALGWAFILILARKTRNSNMFLIIMLSGIIIAVLSLPLANLGDITFQQGLIGALLGTLNGIALSMLTLAPRYIPSAEAAVFLPLESVFGSLLVWYFMAEYPGFISIVAGSIIVMTIMLNSFIQIKRSPC
jgi:drug/metabolite transporter (DMT)-like permease